MSYSKSSNRERDELLKIQQVKVEGKERGVHRCRSESRLGELICEFVLHQGG